MNHCTATIAAGCIGLLAAATATAEDYRAATYLPDPNIHTVHAFSHFGPALAESTKGEITFQLFTGGALLPAKSIMQGVADGVAQMGFHTTGYTPSEVPISNALSGMAFEKPDPYVLGFAYADWVMNDPMGYGEFRRNRVIPVGGFSTPAYALLCNSDPITSLEDIRGKKIRFPGGQAAKLADKLGFAAVNIPAPEMYQALQNGQIDCAGIFATFLDIDMQLHEVTRSVVDLNLAPVFNSPIHVYNVDFWQGLTDEQRRTILDVTASAMAGMMIDFATKVESSLDFAREKGIEVVTPDASLQGAIDAWVEAGIGDMVGAAGDAGVEDPEAVFANFRGYIDKWDGIVGGMSDRLNEEELTQVVKTNLFDPIDVSTYGME